MVVRAELGQDWGSGLNSSSKAGSCVFMKPMAQAEVVLRAVVLILCSCLGRPGKLRRKGLTASALQLCLSHGASEVPQGVLCAAGGHRALL